MGVRLEPMPKIALLSHASAENITKHWLNTTTLHADQNRVPCWPCHKLHDTKDTCVENKEKNGAACISDISVETIMGHVRKYLAQPSINNVIHAEGEVCIKLELPNVTLCAIETREHDLMRWRSTIARPRLISVTR